MTAPNQDHPHRLSTPRFIGLLIYFAGMMAFSIAVLLLRNTDLVRGAGIGLIPGMVMGFGTAYVTVRVR